MGEKVKLLGLKAIRLINVKKSKIFLQGYMLCVLVSTFLLAKDSPACQLQQWKNNPVNANTTLMVVASFPVNPIVFLLAWSTSEYNDGRFCVIGGN